MSLPIALGNRADFAKARAADRAWVAVGATLRTTLLPTGVSDKTESETDVAPRRRGRGKGRSIPGWRPVAVRNSRKRPWNSTSQSGNPDHSGHR